jgi:uncharacterized membrane protein YhaH (DUF805 family)
MKHDVFLSYAREDLAAVKWLVGAIEAEGLSVFWDRHIQLGQQWSDVLEAALRDARAVVVVWSATSVKSTWVKAEATEAMAQGKLVPLRIDDAAIPMPFGQVQTADVSVSRPLFEQGVSIAAAIAGLGDVDGASIRTRAAAAVKPTASYAGASKVVDWHHAYLAMEGRLARRDYWVCYLALIPVSVMCMLLVEWLLGATARDASMDVKLKASVFEFFITLYPRVAILLKRLHDFGWSGWWTLPTACIGLLAAAANPWLSSAVAAERHVAWLFCSLVWIVVVFVGARAGDPGANKFGPPHQR